MAKPSGPNLAEWVWINLKIGTLSVGSTSRVMLYQDEVVADRKWLSPEDFNEILTIAQLLPGPNLINLSAYLGYRFFSKGGAVLATVCLALPGAILAVLCLLFAPLDNPGVLELIRGLSVGSLVVLAVFLWHLFAGLTASLEKDAKAPPRKIAARCLLAALVAALSLRGVPMGLILLGGLALCLTMEFLPCFI